MERLKPLADRRPQRRKKVLQKGIIAYANGAHYRDCTISDYSDVGARICVAAGRTLPQSVYLIDIAKRTAHEADIVWSNEAEAGLRFLASFKLNEISEPSLVYLRKLWHARALT
jgi:hypothetical protein